MRKSAVSFLALCGLAWASDKSPVPAKAADTSKTITVTEKSIVAIRTSVLDATLVVLPEEEKILTTFGGDTETWLIQTTKVPSRYLSIKPKSPGAQTNLHIITDHGNDYSFTLQEVSGQTEPYDVKVFLAPGDSGSLRDALSNPPSFVSAEEANRYKQMADDAKAESDAMAQKAQNDENLFRSSYPSKLIFDYSWDRKSAEKLGVSEIFRDDKFTYIKANPREAPALYEFKDGKPSLINFDLANGLYTVTKILDSGYLAVGKTKMSFARTNQE